MVRTRALVQVRLLLLSLLLLDSGTMAFLACSQLVLIKEANKQPLLWFEDHVASEHAHAHLLHDLEQVDLAV